MIEMMVERKTRVDREPTLSEGRLAIKVNVDVIVFVYDFSLPARKATAITVNSYMQPMRHRAGGVVVIFQMRYFRMENG